MSIPPTDDNTTFIITDNSSHIAKILPQKYIEPLVIIARIKGYDSIDDYVLNLIKDRLEMFADTRDNLDDAFQEFMHNTMMGKDVPNQWARNDAGELIETEEDDEEEKGKEGLK